jgi:putative tricarboxylic transport membrane protein
LLAFVLGDRIEINFRRALTISDGDYAIFLKGPAAQISLGAVVFTTVLIVSYRLWKRARGAPAAI